MANLPKRTDPQERWRPVRGFEGRYEVSTMGRVRKAWPGAREPRVLSHFRKNRLDSSYYVQLFRPGGRYIKAPVLRLVAEAFMGELAEGLVAVHKNGLHTDNRLENVVILSREQLGRTVNRRWRARPVVRINRAGEIVECYGSAREAARAGYISKGAIVERCNRRVADEFRLTGYSYRWDDGL